MSNIELRITEEKTKMLVELDDKIRASEGLGLESIVKIISGFWEDKAEFWMRESFGKDES